MKALVLDAEAKTATVQDVKMPTPAAHEILVHVEAISLNPIDPLYVRNPLASSGRTIGSDFAGTITAIGLQVPPSGATLGERVAGFLQGVCSINDRPGAFAEYLVVAWDLVWKVPENMTIEEAAGVSLVALTAAQSVWYRLGLEAPFAYDKNAVRQHPVWPLEKSENHTNQTNFLIYGASTSVGLFAAQMVRLSTQRSEQRIRLFGAASKARWPLLTANPYNYDHLVDYRDQNWHEQIQELAVDNGMHYVYDAISEGDTVHRSSCTLAPGGRIAIVRSREGGAWVAESVSAEPIYGAVWEGLGERVQYQGLTVERSLAARDFAVQFYRWLSTAIGLSLQPVSIRLMPGGLEKVVDDGFVLLGAGSMEERRTSFTETWMRPVSAEKLVYNVHA